MKLNYDQIVIIVSLKLKCLHISIYVLSSYESVNMSGLFMFMFIAREKLAETPCWPYPRVCFHDIWLSDGYTLIRQLF